MAATTCGGDEGPCGPLARLCAREGEWKGVSARVDEAVEVDLDRDGERELVVLDRAAEQLAVAWPEGQRTMLSLPGQEPLAIAALPGELAVALGEPPVVATFAADASGRLERRREVFLRDQPAAVVAADLAGDGAPELVATVPEAGVIAVIDPATGTMRELPAGMHPLQLDTGDVDGDDRLDVVVVDAGQALQVFLGTGDGGLRAAVASPAAGPMLWIDLGDHDGDGDLDAFTRAGPGQVLVHRNDGQGRFSSPTALPLAGDDDDVRGGLVVGPRAASGFFGVTVPSELGFATWFGKGSTWLGRLDETVIGAASWVGESVDGRLLVGGRGVVLRSEYATGGAAVEIWRDPTLQSSLYTSAVTTGHLDADPLLDVAAVSGGRLFVLHGRADRGLERVAEYELEVEPMAMAIADVTGDGRVDILVSDVSSVWLVQGGADDSYALRPSHPAAVLPYKLVPLRAGPGAPAAIVALSVHDTSGAYDGKGASLLRFAADGSVAEELALGPWQDVFGVVPVDFDEDGVDELLMYARDEETAVLAHMVPDGPGFVVAATHDLVALTGLDVKLFRPGGFAVGDVDGDGAVEAVIGVYQAGVVVSGLGSGAAAATVLPAIVPPQTLRDLDGDGRLDIATAIVDAYYSQRGRGDGTFEPESVRNGFVEGTAGAFAAVTDAQFDVVSLSRSGIATHLSRSVARPVVTRGTGLLGQPYEFVFADVDGDGCDDVVTASRDFVGGVGVLWGAGADPLARGRAINDGSQGRSLAVGDLDMDGDLEVLAVVSPDSVLVYPLRPDAREAPFVLTEPPDAYVQTVTVADVDRDGLPDLVALLMMNQAFLSIARGTGPLQFAPFVDVAEVEASTYSTLEVGDVDGDGDVDVLIRDAGAGVSSIVLAETDGAWSAPELLPGQHAMFSPPDAGGRVDLVTQDGDSIYRHDRGAPERRSLLLQRESFAGAVLRRVADVDRDGRYDLAIADEQGTHVWLRGEDGVAQVTVAELPLDVVGFPDIDGDRRPDVVGARLAGLFVRRTRP
ncbi:FG-GAP repeat domain-containing protein [Nannocystis exedens]|uniref:FG-GAP repeat domain-containing protein n=1 Tax=Nannocystis exedens TaxID=54 RepID=UPI0015A5CC4A|nr:VCBS repeat-containing protein [Nannocystis exedens]